MSCTFNRPRGLKYTDMAIYIDAHLADIVVPYSHPEVEGRVYEYIYHIVYALACKAGYFKNFADYDTFACYAACELFISMRKKQMNAGKEIRGKEVLPVKSSLNFIKATMFPLKVNYQREMFATVLDPKIHEQVSVIENNARESVQQQYRTDLLEAYEDAIKQVPRFIWETIKTTPFRSDPVMCKRLYLSILLTIINDITIPNKLRTKIKSKMTLDNAQRYTNKLANAYTYNCEKEILWHIDEDLSTYIRVLVNRIKTNFSKELNYYIHGNDLSDELVDCIMTNAYDLYTNNIGDDE